MYMQCLLYSMYVFYIIYLCVTLFCLTTVFIIEHCSHQQGWVFNFQTITISHSIA